MEPFEFKPHTVDVLFEAHGFTFEQALEHAALAMFTTIAEVHKVHGETRIAIEEKAETLEELVAYTLGDLLSELDSREMFFNSFKVTAFKQTAAGLELKGYATGGDATPELGGTVVKAVTHHEIKVEKQEHDGREQWVIRVLLDI